MADGKAVYFIQASESMCPHSPPEAGEKGLHGTYFRRIPLELHQELVGDLLLVSNAFAAPLAELFAFVGQGHPSCAFITTEQIALHANPLFWQYGLQHSSQGAVLPTLNYLNEQQKLKRTLPNKRTPMRMQLMR